MTRLTTRSCRWLALLSALGVACTAGAATPPPAEAFGAVPQTTDVVISPDGRTLAWEARKGAETSVTVFDVEAHKVKRAQRIGADAKLRSLAWSDNDILLIGVSLVDPTTQRGDQRYEFFRVLALDTRNGNAKFLLMSEGPRAHVTNADVLAISASKPRTVIMSQLDFSVANERAELGSNIAKKRKDTGWALAAFEVNTLTGTATLLQSGGPFTDDFLVDRTGKVVARTDWNPDAREFRVLVKSGSSWKEIAREQARGAFSLEGLTADGSAILALSSRSGERGKLLALPLDGSAARVVFEDPQREIIQVVHDRFTAAPTALVLGGITPEYHWIDPPDEQRYAAVAKRFPGRTVTLYSQSQDRQRVVAYVSGPSSPAVYYLVDLKSHTADIVGEEYPGLAHVALGEQRALVYKARDGVPIAAYLTVPPGLEARQLPLVVLPHGGPESRDYPRFDWWAQFLVTRGYAVLQPQYRGSAGFGEAFRLAGRRQWGGLMQDDLTDGVKAMIDEGITDGARVCIVGASYGGYAALAGAAFTPELYACAVSVNGPANLPEMLAWQVSQRGKESSTAGYWVDSIGSRLDPQVLARSPAKAVDQIRAPILLIYSADDTVVPPSQSREMAQALKEHGTPVELVRLEGDDHWLSRSETRVLMLTKIEAFLAAPLRK